MKEVKAVSKFERGSSQKARIVANSIRGMDALYAMDVLKYMRKGASYKVRKVLQSAIANAVHNENMNPENLKVTRIFVDDAPMLKRIRAASKGRARRILKRNSNITVYVGDESIKDTGPTVKKQDKPEKKAEVTKKPEVKAEKVKEAAPKKAVAKKKTTTTATKQKVTSSKKTDKK